MRAAEALWTCDAIPAASSGLHLTAQVHLIEGSVQFAGSLGVPYNDDCDGRTLGEAT
jgi:hypothetical protein